MVYFSDYLIPNVEQVLSTFIPQNSLSEFLLNRKHELLLSRVLIS